MHYRPSPKRGRTTLTLMGALIVFGEIAAGILIDYAPLEIRFPQLAKTIDSLRQSASPKKVLFLGSSRTGNAVGAEAVMEVLHEANRGDGVAVFNAYLGAGDPVVMEFETEKLLAAGIRPSLVVIEILPEVLSRRNLWLHFHLGRQFRWPEVWNSLPDSYVAGTLSLVIATRFNAIYTFRNEFQQWTMDALNLRFEFSKFGEQNARKRKWGNRDEPAEEGALRAGASVGRKNVRDYEIGGLNARALEKMVARYAKLATTTVLIAPPVSSPYRAAYNPAVDEAYRAYVQWLGKTYGTFFFDYRDRLADHHFWTPYYTTTDGKIHFSRLLAQEVLVPLLTAASTRAPSGFERGSNPWSPSGKPVAPSITPVGRNPEQEPPAKAGARVEGSTKRGTEIKVAPDAVTPRDN